MKLLRSRAAAIRFDIGDRVKTDSDRTGAVGEVLITYRVELDDGGYAFINGRDLKPLP